MAMFDDPKFLISHIRNSFITSDDTGMCELIIDLDENNETYVPGTGKKLNSWQEDKGELSEDITDSGLESDTELSHSMDIIPDMDITAHRRRSNTAQRLEKLKREKHKQSKIKHIQWKGPEETDPGADDFFEKKDLRPNSDDGSKRRSTLAMQLEQFAACPNNPFSEYARFDGKATPGVPTKKLGIFLTMAPEEERAYPMMVITLSTAKVSDVIGLICWQYTMEGREPKLREELEAFSLYMAEDDGEVDFEFPALDSKEPISKFGFGRLALVVNDIPKKTTLKPCIVVTITLPERGFSKLVLDSETMLLREVLEKLLQKRKLRQDERRKYTLERQHKPGIAVDLDIPLASLDTFEFCLVRENSSRRINSFRDGQRSLSAVEETLSSHQYASYIVSMNHKLFTNSVQLGVSPEKIEVYPVKASGKLFMKQKAFTYDIERIADCLIIETKSSGKATFRLIYQGSHGDTRHHDFESDIHTTQDIVKRIGNILELRSSPFRKEHMERPKRSFSFKRHTLGI